jgi:hypothetical protein
MHGVDSSLSNTNKVNDCLLLDEEDGEEDEDPMKEAFDNIQHPMELMLLSRACIPYVVMQIFSECIKKCIGRK